MLELKEIQGVVENVVNEETKKQFDYLVEKTKKDYENYIDKKLMENAKQGKRELTIKFSVSTFLEFNSIILNIMNYSMHGYEINVCGINQHLEKVKDEYLMMMFDSWRFQKTEGEIKSIQNNHWFENMTISMLGDVLSFIQVTFKY